MSRLLVLHAEASWSFVPLPTSVSRSRLVDERGSDEDSAERRLSASQAAAPPHNTRSGRESSWYSSLRKINT